MSTQVFIDGEAGTTGLQIRERLAGRGEIALIQLDEHNRKDVKARKEALNSADIAILCLPDAAAREAVCLIENAHTRVIDASTAHRTAEGWAYGFPEMTADQSAHVAGARFVANPGCYPQGFIAAIRPLADAGLVPPGTPLGYNAVSGYTGGGKAMIADYEAGNDAPAFLPYGLTFRHKHLPEMTAYAGLSRPPLFQPAVGDYAQGMVGAVPLHLDALPEKRTGAQIRDILAERYEGTAFISVAPLAEIERSAEITPEVFNGTNNMRLYVCANDELGQALILSVYDNLGKGASGAAVQNLNLMLGLDETTGLA